MTDCIKCGHPLGVGRFCLNCGHPVDTAVRADDQLGWRTDTAERPAVIVPPPAHTAPLDPPRFPLYADEVGDPAPAMSRPVPPPVSMPVPATSEAPPSHRRGPAWWPWVVGAVVMLLVAFAGVQLMFGGEDEPTPVAADPTRTTDDPKPTKTPDPSPTEETEPPAGLSDVARFATADVPATAPPNQDVSGNLVRYEARNMLDGVASTCWRMPGDGTGETITFTLGQPTRLRRVGLINGYAKTATDGGRSLDWYVGNRRILAVTWTFEDGSSVTQDLEETRELQVLTLDDPVTTSTVELTLVTVTAPGRGPSARNYTAISDVALVGVPG